MKQEEYPRWPQDYPRLTFKLKKDETGKYVFDENGHPVKVYLYRNDDGSCRELTEEQVECLMGELEDGNDK